jgi:3-deoxy-D-manno-octulosonic-acid transferase
VIAGLARAIYSAVLGLAQPLLRRKLARRGRVEPGYLEAIGERFGRYGTLPPEAERTGRLWIHAVSLGESRAAATLAHQLRRLQPGLRLLVTHGTATGREAGRAWLREGDLQVWQPWDTPGAVTRFLDTFRPIGGVLMETEVWPNLCAACQSRGVALMLANARLNARSLARARRLRVLSRPAYASLAAVWAQTEDDARRLTQAGARVSAVTGNLKFDATPDPVQCERGRAWRSRSGRPILMLASSREGEEALWLQAWRALREVSVNEQAPSRVRWLVVPRHPQRVDEVQALIEAAGLPVSRRSDWEPEGPPHDDSSDDTVWLGDSLGEMALYYCLAQVALLGGSFEPLGGQNLIEAAACGCPVVMGPHTFNFTEAAQLSVEAGAGWAATDMASAIERAQALVANEAAWNTAVQAASDFAQAHRGAAERTARAVLDRISVPAAR